MALKAIPTRYAGVAFRSRLEARYALFLDRLDLKWEYEPQGFTTDGEPYLCDFAIFATLGTIWAEVKPRWEENRSGIERFRRYAAQRPQPSRAVLLIGHPAADSPHLVIGGDREADDPVKGPWEDRTQHWRSCPSGQHFDLAYPGQFRSKYAEDGCLPDPGHLGDERIAGAVSAAVSEKFDGSEKRR